jgi:DNA adenine methylase
MSKNKEYNITEETPSSMVRDSALSYQPTLFDADDIFQVVDNEIAQGNNVATGLQPIIKWPGGKEKELKYILPNAPAFKRFFEPFVGGGSVFMAMRAKEYYINDLSSELIALYRNIATTDAKFFQYVELMDASWVNALAFFNANRILVEKYLQYREEKLKKEELKAFVHNFCKEKEHDILEIIGHEFASYPCILLKEIETNLFRKMTRMRELEIEKHILPDSDLLDNIETAIKSAVYMNYRHMYNSIEIAQHNTALHTALFFFMRNYAYSGMFRYSSDGKFNVPYGGIAYNSKLMTKKLNYYRSKPVQNHFADANMYNLDFETFLRETNPTGEDFIFLDPPYDSEFSTYAQNAFTRADQERLANYMIYECKAKWMLIIKNTDFIYGLYNKEGINIRTFNKSYLVSFMNRNDKNVTHLLITNY